MVWILTKFCHFLANAAQLTAAGMANMATAVSLPLIFGDERDTVIARWNQIQAFWGSGKGFFNQQGQAVQFNSDNPFCRFKVNILLQYSGNPFCFPSGSRQICYELQALLKVSCEC